MSTDCLTSRQKAVDRLTETALVLFEGMQMITFNEVLAHLEEEKAVELKFNRIGGVFSRHELSLDDRKIIDFSYVDDSTSTYTIKQYKTIVPRQSF